MKHFRPAIVLTVWFAVFAGLLFPGLIFVIANAAFPKQAKGSLIRDSHGRLIGSELIGQNFAGREYFHPRPSAAGDGYDAANSGGTNLGPTSDKLIHGLHGQKDASQNFDGIDDLAKAYRAENGLRDSIPIPSDAVTRSGSGLDPDISPANALLQAPRVAKARNLPVSEVRRLVEASVQPRFLDLYGEERVNVLLLNRGLETLQGSSRR